MIVREATLDDVRDIVAVHLTSPDRPFTEPVERLSIAERCSYGGPWMSVETCAIHLNNLLAWGYAPLVWILLRGLVALRLASCGCGKGYLSSLSFWDCLPFQR